MTCFTFLTNLCLTVSIACAIDFISNDPLNATRNAAITSGTIVLGGLFPIHSKNDASCGHLNHERGIHRIEAMLYAMDMINKNKTLLPMHTIGVNIRDTCGVDTHALEESVQFIKGSDEKHCSSHSSQSRIVGVVGAASSGVSIQVANLLRLFQMPQISYASTSPDLIDRHKYKYFYRTVPPDTYQARAIVDIIGHYKWASVHGLYSEGNYGRKGMEAFLERAKSKGICVVSSKMVNGKTDFTAQIERMKKFSSTRVVVLFLSTEHISLLLKAVKEKMASASAQEKPLYKFKWLASDFWGTRLRFITDSDLDDVAEGAITLTPQTVDVTGFKKYFRNLSLVNNKRDPWFRTFWEETHNCTVSNKPQSGVTMCTGNETLPDSYHFDDKIPYVIDSVYAIVHAVQFLISTFCKDGDVNCQSSVYTGSRILEALKNNVSFLGELGFLKFDENGSVLREYEVHKLVRLPSTRYEKLGTWLHKLNGMTSEETITSTCSETCKGGQFRIPKYGIPCCYICKDCGPNEYAKDELLCQSCSDWETPNSTKNGCISLPEEPINPTWVIIMTTMSSFGIIVTFLVIFIFLYHNDTAVVKASGRDLTYPLLIGIILCYSLPYVLLAEPTPTTCGITRFGLGFGFFICYAALVIKTIRIERIFREHNIRAAEKPAMIAPSSQVLMLLVAVLLEALLAIIGLFIKESQTVIKVDKTRDQKLKLCIVPIYDIVVAFSCNILLIITCTVFAFRTRKAPACFNEAKYIGFVMYTTCVIWITFVTVFFGLEFHFQIIAICMCIFLSATSILAGVFGPKVYIIVFRPARNHRSRSGLTIRHAYNNKSFIGEFPGRKLTTTTEVELDVHHSGKKCSLHSMNDIS